MDCALVFPPLWYFSDVPADLTYPYSWLVQHGMSVGVWNLNAAFQYEKFGATEGYRILQGSLLCVSLLWLHRRGIVGA